jgi:hypothetical protein
MVARGFDARRITLMVAEFQGAKARASGGFNARASLNAVGYQNHAARARSGDWTIMRRGGLR